MTDKDPSSLPKRSDMHLGLVTIELVPEDLSGLTQGQLALCRYIDSKTQGERLARRSDINATEIAEHMPNLWLFDLEKTADNVVSDMTVRLLGTKMVEIFGERTGKKFQSDGAPNSIKQDLPETYARLLTSINKAIEHRRPVLTDAEQISKEKAYIQVKVIAIPLSEDGMDITSILGYSEFLFKHRS